MPVSPHCACSSAEHSRPAPSCWACGLSPQMLPGPYAGPGEKALKQAQPLMPSPGANPHAWFRRHHPKDPTCSEEQLHPWANAATPNPPPAVPSEQQLHRVCRRSVTAVLRPESALGP